MLVAPSIVPLKNVTVVYGRTVNLFCDASGRPEPLVSWTQVSTGNKQFNKAWIITDFRERDIGEYRCDASNAYGKDSKSTFISLHGKCTSCKTTPRIYGETWTYVHFLSGRQLDRLSFDKFDLMVAFSPRLRDRLTARCSTMVGCVIGEFLIRSTLDKTVLNRRFRPKIKANKRSQKFCDCLKLY